MTTNLRNPNQTGIRTFLGAVALMALPIIACADDAEPTVDIVVQAAHTQVKTAISLTGSNRYVTGGPDGTVKLVDRDGTLRRTIRVCDYWIHLILAVTPNRLAASCGDHNVYFVDLDSGDVRSIVGLDATSKNMSVTQDGKYLIVGTDTESRSFVAETGAEVSIGHSQASDTTSGESAYSSPLRWLMSSDRSITSFVPTSQSNMAYATAKRSMRIDSLSWSSNGFLALGMEDGNVQIWDTRSGVPIQSIQMHQGPVHSIHLVDDGSTLLSGGFDDAVNEFKSGTNGVTTLWRLKQMEEFIGRDEWDTIRFSRREDIRPILRPRAPFGLHVVGSGPPPNTDELYRASFSPDGRFIVGTGRGAYVQLVDRDNRTSRDLYSAAGASGEISGGAFTADSSKVAVLYPDSVKIYDTRSGREHGSIPVGTGGRAIIITDTPGQYVFVGSQSGSVIGRRLDSGLESFSFSSPSSVSNLAYWPAGKQVIAAGSDSAIQRFSLENRAATGVLTGHTSAITALAVHPTEPILASAGVDGVVLLWNLETGNLLASLVTSSEADWVVADRDGFFDGPARSWDRVRFRVDDRLFAPEQLANRYWQPGILATVLDEKRSFLDSQGDANAPGTMTNLSSLINSAPPVITLRSPGPSSTGQRVQQVTLRVDDQGSGAEDLRLFRNGTVVYRRDGQLPPSLSATVTMLAGDNELTAYAFSRDGVRSAVSSAVAVGPRQSPVEPTMRVLSVGIDDYAAKPLDYARADATAVLDGFRQSRSSRYQWQQIPLMDDAATRTAIEDSFENIARVAQPEDFFVFFFAGHGIRYEDRLHLLPFDFADSGSTVASQRTISDIDLQRWLEPIAASRIMLIFDACHAGQALESADSRWGPMNSAGLGQLAFEKGIYVVGASQSYQSAVENSVLGNGLLTYALIDEGLVDMLADFRPADGSLYVEELLSYVQARVPQLHVDAHNRRGGSGVYVEPTGDDETVRFSVQVPKIYYPPEFEQNKLLLRTR
jgi:WD40 repeat protein